MSILQLQKASLIGLTQNKLITLDALQQLGLLHIIPLTDSDKRPAAEADSEISPELLKRSLHYLLSCPVKRRQVTREHQLNLKQVLQEVDHNRSERIRLSEQRDFLQQRIRDLEPWGEFKLPDPDSLNHQKLWFYLVPNFRMKEVHRADLPWMAVHQDNRHTYVLVVSAEEPDANRMPVPRTHTGDIPLSQLREQLEETEIALEATEAGREALTRWIYLLQRNIANTEDAALLAEVADQTQDYDELFALQGWIAERDLKALQTFAEQQGLVLLLESPGKEELPPTLLDNPEKVGGGQEVVSFFQTPGYRSWDPSRVVFFSFVSFFAIIMSDAGYSLLLGAVLAWYWNSMAQSETGRRLRAMGAALTGAGVVWGVLVGSYFGASAPLPWLGSLKILDLNDFDSMMTLSISIGAAHLILGNLMMAWVRRQSSQSLSSVGWALAVLAALLGWIFDFTTLHWLAFALGLVLVLLFSAPRSSFSLGTLVSGLLALTNVTKIFGDILSYLRLFALGLASASLAITFNQLAADVAAALPGIGLLLQVLILLVGHLLNFVLTVVSGVIHGLRLNLIEFYNWSLADEGYPFQPFAKREVTPWIT
ncbi:V-type ATP synthase subunit I [Marinospirillum alkaliphilum]|uniref:V/A-type H+-transporting ATPase subunit I n=1 Tax=Marinospirillum alkaliphilum DSM 21637 TaxID=1122209 RepID=A0A1K1ZRV4_9GAMM|nr:V-type ATP synthase subunit I [Marinospirillum alkaliphilum]SFX76986.1 V/A-type H+-transporting ATPase subunit I [Marinospirillum alkaliphilum DSM 21637]